MFVANQGLLQINLLYPLSSIVSQGIRGPRTTSQNDSISKKTTKIKHTSSSRQNLQNVKKTLKLLGVEKDSNIDELLIPGTLESLALGINATLHKPIHTEVNKIFKNKNKGWKPEWHACYVSSQNFNINKHQNERPENVKSCSITSNKNISTQLVSRILLNQSQILSSTQIRGFKTRKTFNHEKVVSPSMTNWLKDRLQTSIPVFGDKEMSASQLKELLEKKTHTEEDLKSLKIAKLAFAEGYFEAKIKKPKDWTKITVVGVMTGAATILIVIFYLYRQLAGKMNVHEINPEEILVTFQDVRGVEEAKQDLQEVVEFLKNPDKFTNLGAELPKGVLLVGPPGTGKTLLARAVAGEAGVPFFHSAGPEFDEVLVGQGAKRVRNLFSTAKHRAPCVIFIDEIDSVGAQRSSTVLHPYANQTINQLLSEMDGFHKNEGVIVLGATNRRDDLDKALLRPGRFDVEIQVAIPDLAGRREIFEYYLTKIKTGPDVDLDILARGTIGFTGADIKNVVNQAALRGAIDQVDVVSLKHLESARDKLLMGPEKKSRIPDEDANWITAYHEGGHTLVSYYTKESHPVHKVTIIARGSSLGHTAFIPSKEYYHMTRSQMLAKLDSLMGGRAAEDMIYGTDKVTSGASSDLMQATEIATQMVKNYGMSDKVGLRTFAEKSNALVTVDSLGQSTKETIDSEIKKLLNDSYERAKRILNEHSNELKALAENLMKYETLDAEDVKAILDGRSVEKDL